MTRWPPLAALALLLAASCAAASEPEIELRALADGVWLHTSYYRYPSGTRFPSNGLIARNGDGLILIDTAWGERKTEQLLAAIAAEISLPVARAIVTHAHGDRSAGIDVLEARGIEVFAHPLTRRLTLEFGLPVPDRTLDDLTQPGGTVEMDGLQVHYPGPAHAPDNLIVWLPDARVLFGGCLLRAAGSSSTGNTAHADLDSWQRVLDRLQRRYPDAAIVVPGHGEPGGAELIRHTQELVRDAAPGRTGPIGAMLKAAPVGAEERSP